MEPKTNSLVPSGLPRHEEKRIASARHLDVDSDKTPTEAKLQVRADLTSLSNSVVSQSFTELREILRVLV